MHPMSRITRHDKGLTMTILAALCVALPAFWLAIRLQPLLSRQAALRAEGWL